MGHPTKKVQTMRRGKILWIDEQVLRYTRRKRKERKAAREAEKADIFGGIFYRPND